MRDQRIQPVNTYGLMAAGVALLLAVLAASPVRLLSKG
jgi:hypothetical protein